jgi:hypothetical protein
MVHVFAVNVRDELSALTRPAMMLPVDAVGMTLLALFATHTPAWSFPMLSMML